MISKINGKDEAGSILISALLFVAVSSLFLTGLASIVRTQAAQLTQIQHTYEAKSMIKLTENLLENSSKEREKSTKGIVFFENGRADWEKFSENQYNVKAILNNDYVISSRIILND
ncbi:competence type IV pilus minor pilin ComGG [Marinilactibacillus kalidii]|uniref:competence type IV pilus minor pilin ComGG n=1 Tax=Marinilactibacillus kalidii TaxID=2820274 RepID=UPI001ABE0889|nr:competence type IV pilus minor pilin ComGG [Marinilactibacillus kalidii]